MCNPCTTVVMTWHQGLLLLQQALLLLNGPHACCMRCTARLRQLLCHARAAGLRSRGHVCAQTPKVTQPPKSRRRRLLAHAAASADTPLRVRKPGQSDSAPSWHMHPSSSLTQAIHQKSAYLVPTAAGVPMSSSESATMDGAAMKLGAACEASTVPACPYPTPSRRRLLQLYANQRTLFYAKATTPWVPTAIARSGSSQGRRARPLLAACA